MVGLEQEPMKSYYSFDDIFLFPKFSECASRQSLDTSVKIGNFNLKTPIISANMDTITESEMAIKIYDSGGIGALHRFMSVADNVLEYKKVRRANADCFVSIGVNDHPLHRASSLYAAGARHFIIDIAHGHSILMLHTLTTMRRTFGTDVYIVAGNVATPEAVRDLADWGANCIKIGVGGGSCCKTRVVTGHGVPMFSCLLECCEEADVRDVQIVADGGIRSSGDIVKSLVAGADMVMLGSLFSGASETPGDVIITDDGAVKDFRGMASEAAMIKRYGNTRASMPADEGVRSTVACKGSVKDIINVLTKGIQSGMSYCSAQTLREIPIKARWGVQTIAGSSEGLPHIQKG